MTFIGDAWDRQFSAECGTRSWPRSLWLFLIRFSSFAKLAPWNCDGIHDQITRSRHENIQEVLYRICTFISLPAHLIALSLPSSYILHRFRHIILQQHSFSLISLSSCMFALRPAIGNVSPLSSFCTLFLNMLLLDRPLAHFAIVYSIFATCSWPDP